MVELYPRVAVNLEIGEILNVQNPCGTHVGKKLTKLSPRSWEHVMTAKMGTLGSLSAMIRPANALIQALS